MTSAIDIELIRTTGLPPSERRALERDVRRGVLERIRPGVLVRPGALAGLRPGERHHVMVRAALHRLRPGDVVSHQSAAAVLGYPMLGAPPPKVHVLDATTSHTRVSSWFVRHGVLARPPSAALDVAGVLVTTAPRTAVDVAATRPLAVALPVVDHVLAHRQTTAAALDGEVATLTAARTKAATAIGMGSGLSGSPAESLFRVRCRELAAPEYVQQHPFRRPGTQSAIVDFWFPAQGVVVEIDGRAKYEDPAMLGGRSVEDAHWREKRREDFVRSFPEVRTVVRLSFTDVLSADRVRTALRRAEVPCR
ncbi:hypothetical protein BIU97_02350 [Curtobacterium sp. MCBA15_009]|uniref:hypothetical protein n=1 Tax=Curtobacterium sp. MCBA15_009 TaxID=1898737 RepID=UPI0008DD47EC|nr:hypothetical protein [Curtobacterium sp. MCBA15_009]OII12806.1 hypothetical protein BIU97_02350 [Curtobacterium sp. MCBA15_009]